MAGRVKITGEKQILRNLERVAAKMKRNLRPAMVSALALIQKESMKRTPVDTGNLMGSHRSRVTESGRKTIGTIYLTTAYALFVHEARKSVKFKSPWPRGRKFLERAIVDNLPEINKEITKWLRVDRV